MKAGERGRELQYLTEDNGFIKERIKTNYIALGKKLGAKMKAVAAALRSFTGKTSVS